MGIFVFYGLIALLGVTVLWMLIGGLLACSDTFCATYIVRNKKVAFLFCLLWVTLVFVNACGLLPDKMFQLIPVLGIVSVWFLYDVLAMGRCLCDNGIVKQFTSYTFFIYLIHIPLLLIFKKVPLLLCRNEVMLLFCYIFVPLFFVAFSVVYGSLLKKYFSKLYYLYTGGR